MTKSKNSNDSLKSSKGQSSTSSRNRYMWWGAVLIAFGVLLALSSLNFASLDFWALLKYWPLLLVSAGFGLIASHSKTLFIVATIGQASLLVFAGLVVTGVFDYQVATDPISGRVDRGVDVKSAEVSIKAAGDLNIKVDNLDDIMSYSGTVLNVQRQTTGQVEKVTLKTSKKPLNWVRSRDVATEVILSRNLPLGLEINAGAGSMKADLRGARLHKLDIDSGASDIELYLDSLDQKEVMVDLDLGLANAVLWLPKEAGVYVASKDGLTNLDLPELESKGKGVYQSQNLDQAGVVYRIELNAGLTNFVLKRLAE